ncbi:MAG: OmpA family protein [Bacteroidales bacterium]|nr:OmpA family protein [Bacteroidales bacterium]
MKKTLLIGTIASLCLTSCVTLSEHEDLLAKYEQTSKQYSLTQQELLELKEENAALTRQNQSLNADYGELALAKNAADARADSLGRRIEQMTHHYDTTMENYIQEVAGKSRDLTRAQNLLTARTKELGDKERELQARQQELQEQQEAFQLQRSEMLAKQHELEQQEAATKAQLEAKERELEAVRTSVTRALTGFADKGLKVETKDGKVYVSMENKLLFPPASWTVSKDGIAAIKELAKVLEQDSTLNIMVEGHTDNDAYRGSTAVKDNWDLSVMRATAIVKLLLQHGSGINPARIEACGHGEFAPKVPNTDAVNKAINRRTEIILTPNLDKLLQEMGN